MAEIIDGKELAKKERKELKKYCRSSLRKYFNKSTCSPFGQVAIEF